MLNIKINLNALLLCFYFITSVVIVFVSSDEHSLIEQIFNKNWTENNDNNKEKDNNKEECRCVEIKNCDAANFGEGVLNSRFNDYECKSDKEICCDIKSIKTNGTFSGNNNNHNKPQKVTRDNRTCDCVEYYLCQDGILNKDGATLIDIRIDENLCPTYMQICCPLDSQSQDHDKDPSSSTRQPFIPKPCGHSNPKGIDITIRTKTTQTEFGEYPWMVAVLQDNPSKPKYLGGGSLIHPKIVLTTAHIVHKKPQREIFIKAGEWDPQNTNRKYPPQNRNVADIISHDNFNPASLLNDIALLVLDKNVELAPHINLICLPPPRNQDDYDNFVRNTEKCFSGGWGKKSFETDGLFQAIMKKIELPLVERRRCQSMLRQTRLGRYFLLHESFICAGGIQGRDTCTGDGGSPLICPINEKQDRFEVVGMVAWGIGCGEDGVPGVYADVSYFRNWIDDQLTKIGIHIN